MGEASAENREVLRLEDIGMRFGAVTAIEHVILQIHRGEVVALFGDNSAGKSTLIKIISGGLRPTAGRYFFAGVEQHLASPHDAKILGIETVYQDLSICMNVDVAANFFMGREMVRRVFGIPILKDAEMRAVTQEVLQNAATRIPSVLINAEHLSGGQRQAIELNRFVHWGGRFIVLDEPFAALGVEQVRRSPRNHCVGPGQGHCCAHRDPQPVARISNRRSDRRHASRRIAGDLTASETSPEEVVRIITGEVARRPTP
jgi:D-xylose transport system ATP-binding protein